MSGIFNLLVSSFQGSSAKKLLAEILGERYELQAKYEPIELKRVLADQHARAMFVR